MKLKNNHASVNISEPYQSLGPVRNYCIISNVGEQPRKASMTKSQLMASSLLDKWHFYVDNWEHNYPMIKVIS